MATTHGAAAQAHGSKRRRSFSTNRSRPDTAPQRRRILSTPTAPQHPSPTSRMVHGSSPTCATARRISSSGSSHPSPPSPTAASPPCPARRSTWRPRASRSNFTATHPSWPERTGARPPSKSCATKAAAYRHGKFKHPTIGTAHGPTRMMSNSPGTSTSPASTPASITTVASVMTMR